MTKAAKIAELNDRLRKTFAGGKVMLTAGVDALEPAKKVGLMQAVRTFDKFDEDNDPHHEHDCFLFDFEGDRYAVKFDYYDLKLEYGSEDPSDPVQTTRVMTIMHASDM